MSKKELSKEDIQNWDIITKAILVASMLILIFALVSPLIFTLPSIKKEYDFTNTGAIGDTIGGITSPFIALAGICLTFLAFYMQIKANQIQIKQFNQGLNNEKERRIINEKIDCLNKLKLLKVDLVSIIKDIEGKADSIKDYYEAEKGVPFETHLLFRTPSKKYVRILEIDRLSIFKAFEIFLNQRENWIKNFSNLYNLLDFIPEFLDDIYQKYDSHSKDLFEKKMEVRNGLLQLMNELSKIINLYLAENSKENYLSFPASDLANETIRRYYIIIDESYDENRNPIKETNFEKIYEEVLKFFVEQVLALRDKPDLYDVRLEPIVELASNLTKQIYLIRNRALEFAQNIEDQYQNLMVDKEARKSYLTIIREIHSILDEEIELIEIKE